MNKSEFVSQLAEKTDLSVNKANEIVRSMETIIENELKNGGEVNLTGFISFKQGVRAARSGRNPQTGEPMEIPEAKVVKLKAGKSLKEAIN